MAYNPALDQPAARSAAVAIDIRHDIASAAEEWKAFQREAVGGPHQSYEWIRVWLSSHPSADSIDPAIAFCRDTAGKCVAILPFGVRRPFGCTTLEWLGADQGNYSSGLFDLAYWSRPEAPSAGALLDAVLEAIPGIDAVHLADHPGEIGGLANPLGDLPGVAAPSDGHAFRIEPGWRAESDNRFGARYLKGMRRNVRRLEDYGPLSLVCVKDPASRAATLETLFEQKALWFAERGIPDSFADAGIRTFYGALASAPDSDGFSVRMYALRAGGETVATSLDLLCGNRYYSLISSTATDGPGRYGPGNIHFHRMVEELSAEGVEVFDLGAGESDQKRRWCDERRRRRHALVPVTEVGRLYTAAMTAGLLAKAQIKQSEWLWRVANLMRRYKPRLLASLPFLAAGGATLVLMES